MKTYQEIVITFETNDKDPAEIQWLNITNVGYINRPTFQDKEVVDADLALVAFRNYMNSKTFTFEYDHAAAFFDKDIWYRNSGGTIGFAYVASACQSYRYSINEDYGNI